MKTQNNGNSRVIVAQRALLAFAFLFIAVSLLASAGGGGGGHSSSGDGHGGGGLIYLLLYLIPFPYNFLVLGGIIMLGYFGNKKVKTNSGLNSVPSFANVVGRTSDFSPEFLQRNPAFDAAAFHEKVRTAFFGIQDAWMKQDLRNVRKWISDGVWQRFNTQFLMMQKLGQVNTMSDINISDLFVDRIEQDGQYDIVHVGIHFTMMDNFVTKDHPELNQEGFLENLEYWTFLRKTGIQGKDMYHTANCPNCGGELPQDLGEVSKCPHCGTVTTLGDYDWVLSEITQADDYANENGKLGKEGKLTSLIREAMAKDADFSVQQVEDKASNAYMQLMAAQVTRKPEMMRRFVNDDLFEKYSETIKNSTPYVFNRLYLNNVTLADFYQQQGRDNIVLALRRTSQRVSAEGGKFTPIDYAPFAVNEYMIMTRDTGVGAAAGSLYAHSCPSCGGPLKDTLDTKCPYCGAVLNSPKYEWVVTGLFSTQEYAAFTGNQQLPLTTHAGAGDLDPIYKVRDYAFNNVMLIIGADGKFTDEEITFANTLAKGLGYDQKKIAGMVDLARNNQLVLRLPEERKKAERVLQMMTKAAMADGVIQPEEQVILDDVKAKIAQMAA